MPANTHVARSSFDMAAAPAPTVWSVVRDILTADINLTAADVITKARTRGRKEPDAVIRGTVHTVRKKLKQKAARPPAMPAPAPTPPPDPKSMQSAKPAPKPTPAPRVVTAAAQKTTPPAPAPEAPAGLSRVLSNVAAVNAAVLAAGGVEQARQVAEAVQACGGPDQFAQYLDLVADIRTA